MKQIHWYPGHMKKAQIELQEKLKICDIIIELLDSRIPLSSRNQILDKLTQNKNKIIVLTKADLADKEVTNLWLNFFKKQSVKVIFANLNNQADIKKIINATLECADTKNSKLISKGLKAQPVRAMIIGIPNVGKSLLINKLSKRHATNVENKPGLTRSQQWIKVSNKFELLDTPGILEPSYEDKEVAIKLALVGSINSNILPNYELANIGFDYLKKFYSNLLIQRFPYINLDLSNEECFKLIAEKRGYLSKGKVDVEKSCKVFLNELKNGVLGNISFERI